LVVVVIKRVGGSIVKLLNTGLLVGAVVTGVLVVTTGLLVEAVVTGVLVVTTGLLVVAATKDIAREKHRRYIESKRKSGSPCP